MTMRWRPSATLPVLALVTVLVLLAVGGLLSRSGGDAGPTVAAESVTEPSTSPSSAAPSGATDSPEPPSAALPPTSV